jgi:hypothetical protein
MRRISAIAAVAAACAAFAAPAAASAGGDQVIRDCADDGKLDRHYDPDDLSDANSSLPTDIREYTDCEAVIAAARRDLGGGGGSGSGGTGSGPGGGSGSPPSSDPGATTKSGATGRSPADVSALRTETQQAKHSRPSIEAGGGTVTPASSGLNHVDGAANELPVSLVVAIALLAGLCAVGGAVAARRRWPVIARAPRRLIRR